MAIRIEMKPFAKMRPQVTRNGVYMPGHYIEKKEALRLLYLEAGGHLDLQTPVGLCVQFVLAMPKSWSGAKRARMLHLPCDKKPDLDNLIGAVMDALIARDQSVVYIRSWKLWGESDEIIIDLVHLPADANMFRESAERSSASHTR